MSTEVAAPLPPQRWLLHLGLLALTFATTTLAGLILAHGSGFVGPTATWAALGSWVLVVGTLVILYWQTRQTQQLHSANAVMALRDRFDAPRSRRARRELASALLAGTEELPNIEVPLFFELLGVLTHRGALDEELVWHAFGGWVSNYFYALRHPIDRVARSRKLFSDPLIFGEFEWLSEEMLRIDRRRLGRAHQQLPSPEVESRLILGREAHLPDESL